LFLADWWSQAKLNIYCHPGLAQLVFLNLLISSTFIADPIEPFLLVQIRIQSQIAHSELRKSDKLVIDSLSVNFAWSFFSTYTSSGVSLS
jgi:hypothetical protein